MASQTNSTKTQLSSQMNGLSYPTAGHQPMAAPMAAVRPSVTAFVLRLPDHQKELHQFVWELFDEQLFPDVTIALDDGQYIKAHKLVLSAFSSYFRQVLTRISNPYQYPVIVVKDMQYEDVRSLIEFMYRGCITVPNHRLPQLIKCAKQLKIRGLYETNEENIDENNSNYCRNIPQNVEMIRNNNEIIETKRRECFTSDNKKLEQKNSIILDKNQNYVNKNSNNYSQEIVSDWLNKKSFPVPIAPKFSSPVLTPMQQKIALDLTKRMSNSEQCLPIASIQSKTNIFSGLTSHPNLFRSISVDESQLMKNKMFLNEGIDIKPKRAPSSLDGHLDDNNNDLYGEHRKEKKRNLNIFHAAKYRNRKKQQLEVLFNEENELQKKNCLAKMQIEKLESTILTLIWQQTKKSFNAQTVFICPVCGCALTEVQKLRSHINMLHNDTEALMKFLMVQKSPTFINNNNNNCNNSTNTVPNSTISVPFHLNNK